MTCFFPDGSVAVGDVPCDPDAEHSGCCTSTDYCLSNGYCLYQRGGFSRRSCTDNTWESGGCAQECRNISTDGGADLFHCGRIDGQVKFHCGGDNCTTDAFRMEAFNILLNRDQVSVELNRDDETKSALCGNTIANSATTQPETVTVTAMASNIQRSNTSGMAGIGLGVGLPLFFALLVLGYLLWREKKKTKLMGSPTPMPISTPTQTQSSGSSRSSATGYLEKPLPVIRQQYDSKAGHAELGTTFRPEMDASRSNGKSMYRELP